jgi:hypothetical protein
MLLPGDLITYLLRRERLASGASPLPERERGSPLDPQTMAEFLADDIPFDTPPATGFDFPTEAEHE